VRLLLLTRHGSDLNPVELGLGEDQTGPRRLRLDEHDSMAAATPAEMALVSGRSGIGWLLA
jgi:hypothetical protein